MKKLFFVSFLCALQPLFAMYADLNSELWEHLQAFNGSKVKTDHILKLIDKAIDPNHNREGISLLNWIAFRGTEIMAKKLIEQGARVEQDKYDTPQGWYQQEIGPTPFITAVQQWNEPLALLLIENGASIHICGPGTDDKPLLLAIRRRMYKLCLLLLERGADANTQMWNGTSALSYAYANGDWQDGAALLMRYGAK